MIPTLSSSSTAQAPVAESAFSFPDGVYQAVVEDVEVARGGRPGQFNLLYTLRVIGPTQAGRILEKHSLIQESTLEESRRELAACGLKLRYVEDLLDEIHEVIDAEIEIKKSTRNGEVSIRVQKAAAATGMEAQDDEDD